MAETEIKSVLSVDTGGSIESINDLRERIKGLRATMNDAVVGSEEFTKAQDDLKEAQATLKVVMSGGAESMEDARAKTEAAAGSYNALVKQLAELRTAWKATTDEQERTDLGARMAAVNEQLKELDASVGNFQRNVGNYGSALDTLDGKLGEVGGAFKTVTGLSLPLTQGVGQVKKAFDALAANPILAVFSAIVIILEKLIQHIKSNEEQSQKLKEAMGGLTGVGNMLKGVLDGIAEVVIKLVEWYSKYVEWLSKVTVRLFKGKEASEEFTASLKKQKDAVKALNEVEKEERRLRVESAKVEAEVAELREKATEKEAYSAEERIRFLKDAYELQRKQTEAELAAAEEKLRGTRDLNSANKNSQKTNDEIAGQEAEIYKLRAKLSNQQRTLQRQINGITKEIKAQTEAERKEAEEAWKSAQARIEAERKVAEEHEATIRKLREDAETANAKAEEDNVKRRLALLKDAGAEWGEEYERLLMKQIEARADADTLEATQTISDADALTERLEIIEQERLASIKDYYDRREAVGTREREEAEARAEEYAERIAGILGGDEDLFEGMSDKGLRTYLGSLRDEIALAKEELATMTQGEDEDDETFYARVDALIAKIQELEAGAEKTEEGLEKRTKQALATMQGYAKTVSSLMSTVSDAWISGIEAKVEAGEMDEAEAERQFERAKALQIATATVNTISGALGAFMQTSGSYPFPYGQILGAITAAAVTASGVAQIAEIKRQTLSSSGSVSGVDTGSTATTAEEVVQVPGLSSGVETITLTNTASQEERLNAAASSQKVYVVESEIQAVGRKVAVAESEASW